MKIREYLLEEPQLRVDDNTIRITFTHFKQIIIMKKTQIMQFINELLHYFGPKINPNDKNLPALS